MELIGPKSKFGVDALLRKEAGKTGFADLLVPFSKAADVTVDAIDEELAKQIDGVRRALAELSLRAVVSSTIGSDLFDLTLAPSVTDHPIPVGAIISCELAGGSFLQRCGAVKTYPNFCRFRCRTGKSGSVKAKACRSFSLDGRSSAKKQSNSRPNLLV